MPFINSDPFMTAVRQFRLLYIDGRYGGGKTALAFRIGYELVMTYKYRYLLSNTLSVFNDDPAKVYLREGVEANAVLVLDEGGEFLSKRSEVEQWLSYNRKIDTIMLIPSFLPPSRDVRILTVQRIFNANILGIPAWFYRWEIDKGSVTDGGVFCWWRPFEIFGVYDTRGMPSDANKLLEKVKSWVAQAARTLSYQETASKAEIARHITGAGFRLQEDTPASAPAAEHTPDTSVADLQGVVDEFTASARKAEKAVSILAKSKRSRRR